MSGGDTIFALSSGAGMAGVAVIRVSGSAAGPALKALTGRLPQARQAVIARLRDPARDELIDEALVLWMPGPGSFTGEDVAEFHVHGSPAVVAELLAVLGGMGGLRPAEAGEFSRRAFRNGRMDLVEAEGLGDLIQARTAAQKRQALEHMTGMASRDYERWREMLVGCLARVEASVDFSEEEDIAAGALAGVRERLIQLRNELVTALADSGRGRAIREGVKVVFAGAPNTGKSSLLNRIARREAAIVSAIAGTTRDVIEVPVDLGGIPVILTDTAGLRSGSADPIERIGIARAEAEIRGGDLTIWVTSPDIPAEEPPPGFDSDTVRVLNKSDLSQDSSRNRNESGDSQYYRASALTGEGIPALLAAIERKVRERFGRGEAPVAVRTRHIQALRRCVDCLNAAIDSPAEQIEVMAENLRAAAAELGRVTGRIDVEDLLDSIFRDFCIGK
ncbi:MAG: tRNA uridine-5-carboxymethylaminomethyl(34) synthesis GTPase MnmE [Rhizobiales bacterium]|nr:tRNA uridine-5-carboxymethylaminomethyl(34) synthesis GTPase MnmE [Hyphomicrobiales bacterium]